MFGTVCLKQELTAAIANRCVTVFMRKVIENEDLTEDVVESIKEEMKRTRRRIYNLVQRVIDGDKAEYPYDKVHIIGIDEITKNVSLKAKFTKFINRNPMGSCFRDGKLLSVELIYNCDGD